jgi:hypothetical protein
MPPGRRDPERGSAAAGEIDFFPGIPPSPGYTYWIPLPGGGTGSIGVGLIGLTDGPRDGQSLLHSSGGG